MSNTVKRSNVRDRSIPDTLASAPPAEPPALSIVPPLQGLRPLPYDNKRFGRAGQLGEVFRRYVPPEYELEHLLTPGLMSNHAQELHLGAEIQFRAENLAWVHWFIVTAFNRVQGIVVLQELSSRVPLRVDTPTVTERGNFFVRYAGVIEKYQVVRVSDNFVIRRELSSEADALHVIATDLTPQRIS